MSDDGHIHLRVVGVPVGQGSKSAMRAGDRIVVLEGKSAEGRRRHRDWRDAVSDCARRWMADNPQALLDEPIIVTARFLFQKPKSKPRWKWLVDVTPDVDKLARSVLDSLTGVLLRDDSLVVLLAVGKRYVTGEPPGVEIDVWPCGADERESAPVEVLLSLEPPNSTPRLVVDGVGAAEGLLP